jgi:hypothetical protein
MLFAISQHEVSTLRVGFGYLELGVSLGFEDWNLAFPGEPPLRITARRCVRELQ